MAGPRKEFEADLNPSCYALQDFMQHFSFTGAELFQFQNLLSKINFAKKATKVKFVAVRIIWQHWNVK